MFNNFTRSFVTLNEVKGKGHWFEGVVDDAILQQFLDSQLSQSTKATLPRSFSLFTMNPATTGSRGGLRILQLFTPFESSRIHVHQEREEVWHVRTENVRRVRYKVVDGVYPRPHELWLDSNTRAIHVPDSVSGGQEHVDVCAEKRSQEDSSTPSGTRDVIQWAVCKDAESWATGSSIERGPDTSGPMVQVLGQRKLLIVYPEDNMILRNIAVRIANGLYVEGVSASVSPDTTVTLSQITASYGSNLVLLGGANMNRVAKAIQEGGFSADVKISEGAICVSTRCFREAGTGIAFLSGGRNRMLIVTIAGTDVNGVYNALTLLPRAPSHAMAEWAVVSAQRGWGWRGYGGVVAAGYWDHMWRLCERRTYPSDFVTRSQKDTCAPWLPDWSLLLQILLMVALVSVVVFVTNFFIRRKNAYQRVSTHEEGEHIEERKEGAGAHVSRITSNTTTDQTLR